MFLLAHVLVDTRLIARAWFKEVSGRGGISLTEVQAIADEVSASTFGHDLDRVRSGLAADNVQTAEGLNEARNALLHWKRGRFSLPVYKGQMVTSDAGLQACMSDVLRFLPNCPLRPTGREIIRMIATISVRLVVAAVCLLGLASSASAECAWVLWVYERGPQSKHSPTTALYVHSAYENKGDCRTEIKRQMDILGETDAGGQVVLHFEKGGKDVSSTRYMCLPDTLDPRGPKGK